MRKFIAMGAYVKGKRRCDDYKLKYCVATRYLCGGLWRMRRPRNYHSYLCFLCDHAFAIRIIKRTHLTIIILYFLLTQWGYQLPPAIRISHFALCHNQLMSVREMGAGVRLWPVVQRPARGWWVWRNSRLFDSVGAALRMGRTSVISMF